jgi:hypothetical protein
MKSDILNLEYDLSTFTKTSFLHELDNIIALDLGITDRKVTKSVYTSASLSITLYDTLTLI